uniref:Putative serine/threonine-protein kinase yaka n=1 Tax=Phlebotomus kandelakii TaxID=1109342 RepID=A0A6B2EF31_9DIPT
MVAEFVGRQQSCSPSNEVHHGGQVGHIDMYGHETPLSPHSPGDYGRDGSSNYEMSHLKRKELFTQRKQREFIPDNKKDDSYWDRRRRNNEAAKRSREKRRFNDMVLEQRVVELTKENHVLKAQLDAIKDKYNICGESLVSVDQIMATLPNADQVLTITKRAKLYPGSPARAPPVQSPPADMHAPPLYLPHHTPPLHLHAPPSPPREHPDMLQPPMHTYAPSYHQAPPMPHHVVSKPLSPVAHDDALNLSRRGPASPYDASSGSCASGDDEQCCEAPPPAVSDLANSLPLKLRHKSHLGDKDAAASALLALHHIKQEPLRASPPWGDGEGSSDERDSGISVSAPGEAWRNASATTTLAVGVVGILDKEEENCHLKTQLARLENEVASIKNMMILNGGATAAAQ